MPTTHEKNKITVPFTAKWRDFANQFMNNSCHPMYPLAEFIDNSIASFLIDYKKIKDIDNTSLDKVDLTGLQIDITFNYYSHDHQEIIITDNAGGMNLTTLSEAIQPYHTTDIQRDTRMNQYGVGMKFGIFWLSSGVSIYTKRLGE